MLDEQIDRLSSLNQRLLEVASVAGIEFTADAVAKVSGTPLALVEERCERLARRSQFLRSAGPAELPDGAMISKYAFIHALYQHAFYERIPVGRRARLHRRLAEHGGQTYEPVAVEHAADLAERFERSGVHPRARRLGHELRESLHVRGAFSASPRARVVLQPEGRSPEEGK